MSDSCASNPLALLVGLAEQLQRHFDESAAAVGLTSPQAQLLMQLEAPARMGDLAQAKTCDPSSITTMVQRLERDGLVQRTIDPNDARARLVALSPAGATLRTRLADLLGDGHTVIDGLADEQRAALAALFSRHPATR